MVGEILFHPRGDGISRIKSLFILEKHPIRELQGPLGGGGGEVGGGRRRSCWRRHRRLLLTLLELLTLLLRSGEGELLSHAMRRHARVGRHHATLLSALRGLHVVHPGEAWAATRLHGAPPSAGVVAAGIIAARLHAAAGIVAGLRAAGAPSRAGIPAITSRLHDEVVSRGFVAIKF